MNSVLKFDTVGAYNAFNKNETRHPLVNLVDLSMADPRSFRRMQFGFYVVFLKQVHCGDLRYGRNTYDYQEGTLVFLAPNQIIGENKDEGLYQPQGYALVFHPDLIHGTSLGRQMGDYTFFSYESREALHLSEQERQTVADCFAKIKAELQHPVDKHSKKLIVRNIELFLDYCVRFYDRQFITRNSVHKGVVEQFDRLLTDYFSSDKPRTLGLPTVGYCAEQLHLSPNYFSDLIKKETGKTAKEFIVLNVIELAKEKIFDPNKTASEVAYELGFKYSQHFSRVFKQQVGFTPNEYRTLN